MRILLLVVFVVACGIGLHVLMVWNGASSKVALFVSTAFVVGALGIFAALLIRVLSQTNF